MGKPSLLELADKPTCRGALRVAEVRPGRFPEEVDALVAVAGEPSQSIRVKYFTGRPSENVPAWIEASFPRDDERFAAEVVAALAALLPPGGRLMAVYGNDETERGLLRGFPPVATPIGHALFMGGCTWFKDWYFAEGGREGETKLQGNKPMNGAERRHEVERVRRELGSWLGDLPADADELVTRARERAHAILRAG